jgi:hypothetical protein
MRRNFGVSISAKFLHGTFRSPFRDRFVDAFHLRGAAVVPREHQIVAQVGPADRDHQAVVEAVRVAGDQDIAFLARIQIGGRNPRQRAAGALAHVAVAVVVGDQALHAVEHRLVERDVDDLPFPRVQRNQRADHAWRKRWCRRSRDSAAPAAVRNPVT